MKLFKPALFVAVGFLAFALPGSNARATLINFSGSSAGHSVAATANFTVSGDNLTIVLTNTTPAGTVAQAGVLTGLTWESPNFSKTLSISSITASTVVPSTYTSTDFSGEWTDSLSSSTNNTYGIATSGLGGIFNAKAIQGSANYGIVATGTILTSGLIPQEPYAEDYITFKLTGATGLDTSQITDVKAYFGTAGDFVTAVPEPSTILLLGVVLLGAGLFYRRKRKAAGKA